MSPRAAWRLERMGYGPVSHYVTGKSDWLAAGLPTVRSSPPPARAADVMDRAVPVCGPDELVGDLVGRTAAHPAGVCIVVNDQGVVLGRLRLDRLGTNVAARAEDVMEPGPVTVRADADVAQTAGRMRARGVRTVIVSTPDGVLLGVLRVEPGP